MQEAMPYGTPNRALFPPEVANVVRSAADRQSSSSSTTSSSAGGGDDGGEAMRQMVAENPVLVVGNRGCCMCHVARRLLLSLGVNPTVCELTEEAAEEATVLIERMLDVSGGGRGMGRTPLAMFPVVFVGGKLVGGLEKLMAVHISGELVPILKEAGALWL